MTIPNIPNNLLVNEFGTNLKFNEKLKCRQVCKDWKELFTDIIFNNRLNEKYTLYKSICNKHFGTWKKELNELMRLENRIKKHNFSFYHFPCDNLHYHQNPLRTFFQDKLCFVTCKKLYVWDRNNQLAYDTHPLSIFKFKALKNCIHIFTSGQELFSWNGNRKFELTKLFDEINYSSSFEFGDKIVVVGDQKIYQLKPYGSECSPFNFDLKEIVDIKANFSSFFVLRQTVFNLKGIVTQTDKNWSVLRTIDNSAKFIEIWNDQLISIGKDGYITIYDDLSSVTLYGIDKHYIDVMNVWSTAIFGNFLIRSFEKSCVLFTDLKTQKNVFTLSKNATTMHVYKHKIFFDGEFPALYDFNTPYSKNLEYPKYEPESLMESVYLQCVEIISILADYILVPQYARENF